ncbi:MAG: hypothetical protein K0R61_5368 [Microvirga sp.]|nr:hypothetical protein [Microvirga sp.]
MVARVSSRRWRMGVVAFTVARAQGPGRRKELNGHAKPTFDMASTRPPNNQNDDKRVLLSPN